ncbi:hypothetical protein VNO77_42832 [Canavalia gladiata]|uniref:Uncharacterized protein n=1 Tax=Canavalia gladiata TaxID=3824 RepID=A0AAN9PPI0_CANGL
MNIFSTLSSNALLLSLSCKGHIFLSVKYEALTSYSKAQGYCFVIFSVQHQYGIMILELDKVTFLIDYRVCQVTKFEYEMRNANKIGGEEGKYKTGELC